MIYITNELDACDFGCLGICSFWIGLPNRYCVYQIFDIFLVDSFPLVFINIPFGALSGAVCFFLSCFASIPKRREQSVRFLCLGHTAPPLLAIPFVRFCTFVVQMFQENAWMHLSFVAFFLCLGNDRIISAMTIASLVAWIKNWRKWKETEFKGAKKSDIFFNISRIAKNEKERADP